MKYLEFTFRTVPCTEIVNDVLSGVLGEAGFESFVEQTDGITAYIQKELYNESLLKEALADFPLPDTQIEYNFVEAEDKDWNEEWEKNFFQPIVIGDRCVIHSTFHNDVPQAEYDIVINPQMAFGTGHHETTSLIIGELLDRVEAHYGVKPILYTSYKFKKRYLSDSIFNAYPYWIAHYYVDSVRYEGKWHFWQHTDVGTVPGIEEEVDLNVFNGTMEELLELTLKTPCIER